MGFSKKRKSNFQEIRYILHSDKWVWGKYVITAADGRPGLPVNDINEDDYATDSALYTVAFHQGNPRGMV